MEAWRLKMELWRVYRPVVAGPQNFEEELDPDPDPNWSEKLDPDTVQDPHWSDAVPQPGMKYVTAEN